MINECTNCYRKGMCTRQRTFLVLSSNILYSTESLCSSAIELGDPPEVPTPQIALNTMRWRDRSLTLIDTCSYPRRISPVTLPESSQILRFLQNLR